MAYPTLRGSSSGKESSATTAHSTSLWTTANANDFAVVVFVLFDDATITDFDGLTIFDDFALSTTAHVYILSGRLAASQTTIDLVTSTSDTSITLIQQFDPDASIIDSDAAPATGTDEFPDPQTPSNPQSDDAHEYIAAVWLGSSLFVSYPLGYGDAQLVEEMTDGGAVIAKQDITTTNDPDAFEIDTATDWVAASWQVAYLPYVAPAVLGTGEFVLEGASIEFSGTNRVNLGPGSFFSASIGAVFGGTNRVFLETGMFETESVDGSFGGSNRILLEPGDFASTVGPDADIYSMPRIILAAASFATETAGGAFTPPPPRRWFGPTACGCRCSIIPDTCVDNNCYNDRGVKFNQTGFYYEMTKAVDTAQQRVDYYDADNGRHIAYETLVYSGFSVLNHSRLIEFNQDTCQFVPFREVLGRANWTSVQSLFDTYVQISPATCGQNGPYTRSSVHQIEFTMAGDYGYIGGTYSYYITMEERWLSGPGFIFPFGCAFYKGGSPIVRLQRSYVVSGDTGDLPFGVRGAFSWGAATHCYDVDVEYDPTDPPYPITQGNYFKPLTNQLKEPFRSMRFYGVPVF